MKFCVAVGIRYTYATHANYGDHQLTRFRVDEFQVFPLTFDVVLIKLACDTVMMGHEPEINWTD